MGFPTLTALTYLLDGLGLITFMEGESFNLPVLISWAIFSNQLRFIPSNVSLITPLDMFPALLLFQGF